MREQKLIDDWSKLLVRWTEAHMHALERQKALDEKMTNHFVYGKAAPEHSEQQQVDALWQQESEARGALDRFMQHHEI